MFYSEKTPSVEQVEVLVKFDDFSKGINKSKHESVLPIDCATNCYNFNTNTGALTSGMGLKPLQTEFEVFGRTYTKEYSIPSEVTEIQGLFKYLYATNAQHQQDPLFLLFSNQKFYFTTFNTLSGFDTPRTMDLYGNVVGINYNLNGNDYMIFAGTNSRNFFYVFNGSDLVAYTGVPSVVSLAKYAGRLFAISSDEENRLYFSDDLDPRNWYINSNNEALKHIDISDERGKLNKLIEWNNYLYVIREYGITRVTAWEDQKDFVLRNLYLSTGKIYSNTVTQCGNALLMLCKDGLYSFDGTDAKKINMGLDGLFDGVNNDNALATYWDGKYYLACTLNFNDVAYIGCEGTDCKNNALIEYDINTGGVEILRGVDIKILFNLQILKNSKLVCVTNRQDQQNVLFELTHDGEVAGSSTKKLWQSPTTNLGAAGELKVLKNIIIKTNADMQITINTDNGQVVKNIRASTHPRKYKIEKKCTCFNLVLSTNESNVEILPPTITVAMKKESYGKHKNSL